MFTKVITKAVKSSVKSYGSVIEVKGGRATYTNAFFLAQWDSSVEPGTYHAKEFLDGKLAPCNVTMPKYESVLPEGFSNSFSLDLPYALRKLTFKNGVDTPLEILPNGETSLHIGGKKMSKKNIYLNPEFLTDLFGGTYEIRTITNGPVVISPKTSDYRKADWFILIVPIRVED